MYGQQYTVVLIHVCGYHNKFLKYKGKKISCEKATQQHNQQLQTDKKF